MANKQVISYFTLWKLAIEDHQITEVRMRGVSASPSKTYVVDWMAGIFQLHRWNMTDVSNFAGILNSICVQFGRMLRAAPAKSHVTPHICRNSITERNKGMQ